MDKNSIIGLLLIGALLVAYSFWNQPSKEELARLKHQRDSIAQVEQAKQQKIAEQTAQAVDSKPVVMPQATDTLDTTQTQEVDSLKTVVANKQFGEFSTGTIGENHYYTIENEFLKIKLSSRGGRIFSVQLKNYKTWNGEPIVLFTGDSTVFGFSFFSDNRMINTNQLFFQPIEELQDSTFVKNKPLSITMRLKTDEPNKYIDYHYTIYPKSYMIDYTVSLYGMNEILKQNSGAFTLNWQYTARKQEKSKTNEDNYTNIYYKFKDDEVDYLSQRSDDKEDLTTNVRWIAFKQQFFSSVLIADDHFSNATVEQKKRSDTSYLKQMHAEMALPFDISSNQQNFKAHFLFTPNKFSLLQSYSNLNGDNIKLFKLVDLGWAIFAWVNRFIVIPVFDFFSEFTSNFGLIILLLTIVIKSIVFPFTYKSYMSSAKMRILKPQIDEINAKIPKEKTMERQQAMMALYKKAGVNPMGGCLPMLFQMPILYAMFRFFPSAIELRQQSFLWAHDLSTYDSIYNFSFNIPMYGDHISLFALLMTISVVLYTKVQNDMNPSSSTMPGMKSMMYIMPIFFLLFMNNYSSGLSYYYFLANVITFGQMFLIRRFIDEEKLLKKMNSNKAKVKKKSKFQQRMEEAAKAKQQRRKR